MPCDDVIGGGVLEYREWTRYDTLRLVCFCSQWFWSLWTPRSWSLCSNETWSFDGIWSWCLFSAGSIGSFNEVFLVVLQCMFLILSGKWSTSVYCKWSGNFKASGPGPFCNNLSILQQVVLFFSTQSPVYYQWQSSQCQNKWAFLFIRHVYWHFIVTFIQINCFNSNQTFPKLFNYCIHHL